jgi:hypothetical protein
MKNGLAFHLSGSPFSASLKVETYYFPVFVQAPDFSPKRRCEQVEMQIINNNAVGCMIRNVGAAQFRKSPGLCPVF